jgi:hypothetical protein
MAIGTAAALLGGAALSAGASAYSAGKANKAATNAANQNAALLQGQYNQTRTDLQPYTQFGYQAGNALSNRLFSPPPGSPDYAGYVDDYTDLQAAWNDPNTQAAWGGDKAAWGENHWNEQMGRGGEGRELDTIDAGPEQEFMTMERPEFGPAPGFYMDPNPSQRYKDELADSTRSINARSGAQRGYYSGGRALALQGNTDKLWAADEQRRFQNAMQTYQSALGQYNQDRSTAYQAFDADRGFGANRYDTQTGNLFNLLGIGANATQSLAGYGQNNANALAANNNALAGAKGNAAIATGNGISNALGQAAMGYGLYGGNPGYGASPTGILSGQSKELSRYF